MTIAKKLTVLVFALAFGMSVSAANAGNRDKIDPNVFAKMDELGMTRKAKGPGSAVASEALRIIVHLDVSDRLDFGSVRSSNARTLVADRVSQAQNNFVLDLRSGGLLDEAAFGEAKSGLKVIKLMEYQYAVVGTTLDAEIVDKLAARSDVRYVELDKLNKLLTVEGRALVGSDTAAGNGYNGSGIGVAVIDSHFDLLHSELGGSTNLPNGVVYGGQNYSDPGTSIHSQNFNDCYHGTGTASIVRRYATNASLYCLTVFPNAFDSVIADAINWCVTNKNGTGGGSPIKVISMSLGGGQYTGTCNSGLMHTAAGTALANGILVFAASGNDGWTNSMGSPACSGNVISVGSVWDENGAAYSPFPPANCSDSNRQVNERTCYSDTSSVLDVYAPSEEVICAQCGGGTWALGGTSSACPAAAGMTAQLLDADGSLAGDKAGVVSLYQSTGVQVIGDTSKRRIDLTAAIGGGGGGSSELENGVSRNLSLGTDATVEFTIDIPANASDLTVTITGSGDLDLYVKSSPINWPSDQGSHNTSTFKAPYKTGSEESVTFASPGQGTWYVLVHGYSAGSGSIVASWTTSGGGTPQWNYVSHSEETPHNYSNNKTYEFVYEKAGAQQVAVHFATLDTESNYDFVYIFDKNGTQLYKVSGALISGGSGSAFGRTDGWVVVSGDKVTVRLVTDYSVTDYGYKTDQAAYYQ